MLDKDGNEIPLKDYSDDEPNDEKQYSDQELGQSVLDNPDGIMYDDEEGAAAADSSETMDDSQDEEVFVYDENENDNKND